MNWKAFMVLYEDSEGLVRLQEVLKLSSVYKDLHITVRQLIAGPGGDYRPLLKDIKSSGATRIVLDCNTENIFEILKQAQQVGIMTAYHTFFITSLVKNYFKALTSFIMHFLNLCLIHLRDAHTVLNPPFLVQLINFRNNLQSIIYEFL